MLLITLNAAFSVGFLAFAFNALRRGVPFLRDGWLAVQTQARRPDFRQNVERRRLISDGGYFLIGGLLWLGASAGALALGLWFGWTALMLMRGQG